MYRNVLCLVILRHLLVKPAKSHVKEDRPVLILVRVFIVMKETVSLVSKL